MQSSVVANMTYPISAAAAVKDRVASDSIKGAIMAGMIIITVFFLGFGTWSVTAPLNGAVVGNGFVKVEGNRKSVQHLDGGIVKELLVKEGDRIKSGEIVLVLDDSQARAEYNVLSQQNLVLRAMEERLRAEFTHQNKVDIPEEFRNQANDPQIAAVFSGQALQFESRLAALDGQRSIIKEKIAQLESQISGGAAQVEAFESQLVSIQKEMKSLAPLVEKGLIARPRYLQLERTAAGLLGQAADGNANIAKARQAIAEQRQQSAQLESDRMADVAKDLRDTQAKLLEVIPRLVNARSVLGRTEIRSPYAGRVVGLSVFSVGGVINRGDKIMDVVPDQETLVIEAQIGVDDISLIRPEMAADIHLTAYKQRITPVVRGEVIQVSADRLEEKRTGAPYYTALVRVEEGDLALLPHVKLYPGMSAMVMIPTTERTAFDYLVGPLVMSFKQAFRQL